MCFYNDRSMCLQLRRQSNQIFLSTPLFKIWEKLNLKKIHRISRERKWCSSLLEKVRANFLKSWFLYKTIKSVMKTKFNLHLPLTEWWKLLTSCDNFFFIRYVEKINMKVDKKWHFYVERPKFGAFRHMYLLYRIQATKTH